MGNEGRVRESGPGEAPAQERAEEWLVVGCGLGEIVCCAERSQREHRVQGKCQAVCMAEWCVSGKRREWRLDRGKGRPCSASSP